MSNQLWNPTPEVEAAIRRGDRKEKAYREELSRQFDEQFRARRHREAIAKVKRGFGK